VAAESPSIPLHNPVRISELVLCLSGVALLAGLALEWGAGSTGYQSVTLLKLLIIILGVVSVPVPLVLRLTMKSDIPIVWETLLLTFSVLLSVVLIIKTAVGFASEAGLGFWVVFAGCLFNTVAAWHAVSRER
jgi:hypothetical protein